MAKNIKSLEIIKESKIRLWGNKTPTQETADPKGHEDAALTACSRLTL